MTLLLGPPGAGKTTLLLALAGKLDKSLRVSFLFILRRMFGVCNVYIWREDKRSSNHLIRNMKDVRSFNFFFYNWLIPITCPLPQNYIYTFFIYFQLCGDCAIFDGNLQVVGRIYSIAGNMLMRTDFRTLSSCSHLEMLLTTVTICMNLSLKEQARTSVNLTTTLGSLRFEKRWTLQHDVRVLVTNMVSIFMPMSCDWFRTVPGLMHLSYTWMHVFRSFCVSEVLTYELTD